MTPEEHRRVASLVGHAMEQPAIERRRFLRSACGDDASLFQSAESWLASCEGADDEGFLRRSPAPSTLQLLAHASPNDVIGGLPQPGDLVGQYLIEARLGEGGIGTVYRARDTNLGRTVAIKILSAGTLADDEARRRFRREAEALARLTHPNVSVLFEFASSEGYDYLVMEYVPGRSLAELVDTPKPDETVRTIGAQLATALGAAHLQDLAHGDLKPANVRITPEGTAKLLDFGLARTLHRGDAPLGVATASVPLAGTLPYMAPEFFRGSRPSQRSDIYALGVVLYQLATGRRPFDGGRDDAEPPAPRDVNPDITAETSGLILRCLALSPRERPGSCDEIVATLKTTARRDVRKTTRASYGTWVALALAATVVIVAVAASRGFRPAAPAVPAGVPDPVVTWGSSERHPALSPDGRWLSFTSDRGGQPRIWLLSTASSEERELVPAGGQLRNHVWSPESDRIAYLTSAPPSTLLTVADPYAAEPMEVYRLASTDAFLVRWIGHAIYYVGDNSLRRFDLGTRQATEVSHQRGALGYRGVDISGDERRIVFTALRDDRLSLWAADADGSSPVRLTDEPIRPRLPRWRGSSSTEVLFVSDEGGQPDVWFVDVATAKRRRLTLSPDWETGLTVSGDGSEMLFEALTESANLKVLAVSAQPPAVHGLTSDSLSDLSPSASTDGTVIAYERASHVNRGSVENPARIIVQRTGQDAPREVAGEGRAPLLSPDGRFVSYLVGGSGGLSEVWIADIDGRESVMVTDRFLTSSANDFPFGAASANLAWSPAAKELYFVARAAGGVTEIQSVSVAHPLAATNPTPILSAEMGARVGDLRPSPDGRRLAYVVESERRGLWGLSELDLVSGAQTERLTTALHTRLRAMGYLAEPDGLVVIRFDSRDFMPEKAEVMVLQAAGAPQRVAELAGPVLGSAVLDPSRRVLYLLRDEQDQYGIWSVTVDSGEARRILASETLGRAFTGMTVLGDGQVLLAEQVRNRDIWSAALGP